MSTSLDYTDPRNIEAEETGEQNFFYRLNVVINIYISLFREVVSLEKQLSFLQDIKVLHMCNINELLPGASEKPSKKECSHHHQEKEKEKEKGGEGGHGCQSCHTCGRGE